MPPPVLNFFCNGILRQLRGHGAWGMGQLHVKANGEGGVVELTFLPGLGFAPWKVAVAQMLPILPSPIKMGVAVHRSFSLPPVFTFFRACDPVRRSVVRPTVIRVIGTWSMAPTRDGGKRLPSSLRRAARHSSLNLSHISIALSGRPRPTEAIATIENFCRRLKPL